MSDYTYTVYEFDGSGGCELCQQYTGWYYHDEPDEPHPGCNCSVTETEIEVDPSDVDVEVETKTRSTSEAEYVFLEETFHNDNKFKSEFEFDFQTTLDPDDYIDDDEIREYFDISDELEPLDIDTSGLVIEVEPGETATLEILVNVTVTEYELELAYTYAGEELFTHEYEGTVVTYTDYTPRWHY
ncbi:hypothetical protein ACFL2O_05940 [Thermodesulfobacteriota bacterium]